jgi:hypothetical protein
MRNELSIHDFLLHLNEFFLFKNKIKFSYESHLNIFIIGTRCSVFYFILQGENKCPGAMENGVSILHGNALAFVKVTFRIQK